jgi:hypothetical protein
MTAEKWEARLLAAVLAGRLVSQSHALAYPAVAPETLHLQRVYWRCRVVRARNEGHEVSLAQYQRMWLRRACYALCASSLSTYP